MNNASKEQLSLEGQRTLPWQPSRSLFISCSRPMVRGGHLCSRWGSRHLCPGAKSLKPDLACQPEGAFSAFTQLDLDTTRRAYWLPQFQDSQGSPAFPRRRLLWTGFLGAGGEELELQKEQGSLRAAAPAVTNCVPQAVVAGEHVPAQYFLKL